MTGFAAAEVEGDAGVTLTIKGVNHRFLDLSLRLPPGCDALEMRLRSGLKERLRRGHVELTLLTQRRGELTHAVDAAVLASYVSALREAAGRFGIEREPELTGLLRLPGVVSSEGAVGRGFPDELQENVVGALGSLLDEFDRGRAREGEALATALRESLAALRVMVVEARGLRAGVRDAHVARLRDRMGELLTGAAEVNEARLLTEAALLAERSDLDEELVRMHAHVERFAEILDAGGEVGKRLDFLTQEMNREANTVLSKTGSAAGRDGLRLTEIGLECKVEIERMREQVQNLE